MTNIGFSVRLYFPDGDTQGLRMIGISNWAGQGLGFSRELLPSVAKRVELNRPGVYVLWEGNEWQTTPQMYVGQTENVFERLTQHDSGTELTFWTDTVAFTSKDDSFSIMHTRSIEASLIQLAKSSNRAKLVNKREENPPPSSEADRADVHRFLQDVLTCLPVLGLTAFLPSTPSDESEESKDLEFSASFGEIEARAKRGRGQELVVLAGSMARKDQVAGLQSSYVMQRDALVADGVLIEKDCCFEFARDYIFRRPSPATAVVSGSTPSARDVWKTSDGRTLRDSFADDLEPGQ